MFKCDNLRGQLQRPELKATDKEVVTNAKFSKFNNSVGNGIRKEQGIWQASQSMAKLVFRLWMFCKKKNIMIIIPSYIERPTVNWVSTWWAWVLHMVVKGKKNYYFYQMLNKDIILEQIRNIQKKVKVSFFSFLFSLRR